MHGLWRECEHSSQGQRARMVQLMTARSVPEFPSKTPAVKDYNGHRKLSAGGWAGGCFSGPSPVQWLTPGLRRWQHREWRRLQQQLSGGPLVSLARTRDFSERPSSLHMGAKATAKSFRFKNPMLRVHFLACSSCASRLLHGGCCLFWSVE